MHGQREQDPQKDENACTDTDLTLNTDRFLPRRDNWKSCGNPGLGAALDDMDIRESRIKK